MSTRSTIYLAVNGVCAGATSAEDAKTNILEHIGRELLTPIVQELTVDALERLAARAGCAFVAHGGKISNIEFC